MAKVDDLRQRRPKQVILTIVARHAHRFPHGESRSRRNHEPPKSGIPKRKKTVRHTGHAVNPDTSPGEIGARRQTSRPHIALPQTRLAAIRPNTSNTTKIAINMKNRIRAMSALAAAIPPNPKIAAIVR
jgi:hypothetical protein